MASTYYNTEFIILWKQKTFKYIQISFFNITDLHASDCKQLPNITIVWLMKDRKKVKKVELF